MSTFTGYGELSLSIVVSVPTLPEDVCLIVQDSLLEFMLNALSDGEGDLSQVNLQLRDFLEILTGLPQVCWIVTCRAPLFIRYLSLEVSSHLK